MGTTKAFILYPHPPQKINEVRTLLKKFGTKLRVLEESTQHSGRADFYVGLMETCVGKDTQETNSPMQLWCYESERRAAIMTLTEKQYFQISRKESIHGKVGRDGCYLKPMSVWLV